MTTPRDEAAVTIQTKSSGDYPEVRRNYLGKVILENEIGRVRRQGKRGSLIVVRLREPRPHFHVDARAGPRRVSFKRVLTHEPDARA